MKSKYSFLLFVTIYFGIISEVALSLGITTSKLSDPVVPAIVNDPTFIESLDNIWRTATDNVGSFVQIITFSTILPNLVNIVFFIPVSAVALFMLLDFLRGNG